MQPLQEPDPDVVRIAIGEFALCHEFGDVRIGIEVGLVVPIVRRAFDMRRAPVGKFCSRINLLDDFISHPGRDHFVARHAEPTALATHMRMVCEDLFMIEHQGQINEVKGRMLRRRRRYLLSQRRIDRIEPGQQNRHAVIDGFHQGFVGVTADSLVFERQIGLQKGNERHRCTRGDIGHREFIIDIGIEAFQAFPRGNHMRTSSGTRDVGPLSRLQMGIGVFLNSLQQFRVRYHLIDNRRFIVTARSGIVNFLNLVLDRVIEHVLIGVPIFIEINPMKTRLQHQKIINAIQ